MSEDKEEAIPILNLEVVSKKGTIPAKMSGSLKIPVENEDSLELDSAILEPPKFPNNGQAKQHKWQVHVDLSSDALPKPMVVKGKVCHKYICINALLSFECTERYTINYGVVEAANIKVKTINEAIHKNDTDEIDMYLRLNCIRPGCLLSECINPGEWLLPIKANSGKLLAYIKVKIVDQIDEPPKEPEKDTAKA